MNSNDVKLDLRGLDRLLRALKGPKPKARIGILSDSSRVNTNKTNAEVGAYAEFGTAHSPVRSWLRVPLTTYWYKRLMASEALDKETIRMVIAEGSVLPWLKRVMIIGEGIIAEAFDTGGFGQWPPSDMRNKKNHQTLIETQQLRNSVTSEVKE